MAYIYKTYVDSTNYLIEPRLYTTATLETGTNNSKYYTASIADFELIDGVQISIKIPNDANGTSLKIGSNETIPIYYNGSNIETGLLQQNRIYSFIYTNNVWNLVGDIDSPRAPIEHTHVLNEITDAVDLQVIESLAGTAGFLKKTGANQWTLDNTNYTTNTGTVTSVQVQASEPLQSSTNNAQNTSLNTTISFKNQQPNKVLAGPSTGSDSGAPTFRSLVLADLPTGTGATQVAIGNHTHGNITNDGKLSTANRMVYTDGNSEITVSSHTVEANKLTVNISSDDTTDKKRFKVLGNNRFLSIGGSGIQAYSTSNSVDTASKLYLQYNGGNLEIGQSSVASAITGNFYGTFNFRTAGGFVYVGIQATNTSSTNLSRPIWFSAAENSTKYIAGTPVYDNTFKYNPKNQTLSIGNGTLTGANYSGKAATAGVADSANAVTWEHVSEKPSTATSWPTFAQVKDKPTTLEGYGITDAAPINSPTFTGTPKSVTPSSNSDSKMIATKEYVDGIVAVADALVYKGILAGADASTNGGTLTPAANRGDTYKVSTAGYINGDYVEVGDMLICLTDNTAAATTSGDNIYTTIKTNWNIIQTSEGTVSSSVTNSTDNGIARFDGTSGRLIQDSSTTIDDNGHISITHAAGESGELRIKYSTTIDYWWGVGSGNENHGLYDVKANKWILSAGTANTWTLAGTANLATTVTTTADTTNALYPVGVTSSATSTLKRDTSITMTGGTINASALEIGASGKYVNFTSSGIKLGDSGTAVSNGANLITVNGHMVVNGTYNTANNYSEGIRINRSSNGWAEVTMGGTQGTTSGTGLGVWLVGTYATPHNGTTAAANITDSKFYIAYNGSNTATCRITGENDNGFSIRPRLSINDDIDTDYTFKSNGKSWITGPLHIGNTDTAGTGTGQNGYTTNNSGSNNYIAFYGVYNDNPGSFNHTYIGESIYGSKTETNEKSELLLFHGNDASSSSGPDRIRLFAAQVDIQVYTSTTAGTWDSIRATNGIQVANFASEKLTITGNIVPDATNSNRTLGTSSLKWANTYSTSFTGDTIYLANDSSSAYNSKGIQFAGGSRIGEGNSSNGLGIYGVDTIYIRPDTNGSAGSEGVLIDSDGLYPSNNNSENLGLSDHKWSNVYATTFTGSLSGNASTATQFSSNATVTLTGDTTGTSAGSKKSWSITTTTSKMTPTNAASTDLNTLTNLNTAYYYAGGSNSATHGPVAVGTAFGLHMFRTADGYVRQEFAANNGDKYYRSYGSNAWTDWVKYLSSENYDSYALPLSGGTMTGNINRFYSAASTEPMITLISQDKDILFFEIGHGTEAATTITSNHYRLLYKGSNSSPNNYLQLIAHNGSENTDNMAIQFDENGQTYFKKDLKYIGTKATTSFIQFIDNTSGTDGNGMKIGSGGAVVIGSGESYGAVSPVGGTEILYLLSDNEIYLETNAQNNSGADRVGFYITKTNALVPVKKETATDNFGSIGESTHRWANVYATTFTGDLTGDVTGNADTATELAATQIKSETEITDGTKVYTGSGSSWTGSLNGMAYGTLLHIGTDKHRSIEIWGIGKADRTASNSLQWRHKTGDGNSWQNPRTILDDVNTYAAKTDGSVISISRNTETKIATINGVDIKIKIPASDNTNNAVTQTAIDTNGEYSILLKKNANKTDETTGTNYVKTKSVTVNPSTATVSAIQYYATGSTGANSSTPGFKCTVNANAWSYMALESGTTAWHIAVNNKASDDNTHNGALQFRPNGSNNIGPSIMTTGEINRWVNTTSNVPLIAMRANNKDAVLWEIGHASHPYDAFSNHSYKMIYKGTGDGVNNTLQLVADYTSDTIAMQINLEGRTTFQERIGLHTGTSSVTEKVTLEWNSIDQSLDFIFA